MKRYNDEIPYDYTWIKQRTWGEYYHHEVHRCRDNVRSNLWIARQAFALYQSEKEARWYKMYIQSMDRAHEWKVELKISKQRANDIDRTR